LQRISDIRRANRIYESDKPKVSRSELYSLLKMLGFEERIRGDHHIFTKDNVPEIINIQPKGSNAKVYQVRQIRDIILKHKLGG